MDSWVWILIAVAAIIVVAAVVFAFVRRWRQRRELRDWFAPESLSKRRES
jgi:peptidoglycan/LPS O-acetylase OafA/YrhL